MYILGIESSCDETAIAIIDEHRQVLSSSVASQIKTHAKFGGVVPEIAAREHLKSIQPLFELTLAEAQVEPLDIDLITVTQGPGLIGPLLIGANFASGLGISLNVPVVAVDHVHAHIHGAFLGMSDIAKLFPALALVVSGGHTNLYYMQSAGDFDLLAFSLDDACGESFDKVAKLLDLGYPGGPAIELLASKGAKGKIAMPTAIEKKDLLRFSYSGLKTHVANAVRMEKKKNDSKLSDIFKSNLAHAFQDAALDQIVRKVTSAHKMNPEINSLIISGGVAANQRFRQLLSDQIDTEVLCPELKYCGDNAAMIAAAGLHAFRTDRAAHPIGPITWEPYSRYRYENH